MKQGQSMIGMSGTEVASGNDAGISTKIQDGNDQIAKAGQDSRGIATRDFGIIFAKKDITKPMQAIFNHPMVTPKLKEGGCVGLFGRQAGDTIAHLNGDLAGVELNVAAFKA